MTTGRASSNPPSHRARVEQRIVAPLILGVAALIAIANVSISKDGVPMNPFQQFFDKRDRLLLDQFHEGSHKTPPHPDIIVLAIDDSSQKLDAVWPEELEASPALQAMKKPWIWPRRVWAYVLDRMFSAGAKCVFLDLVFKAPSDDPEDDRLFREALARHKGKVILGAKYQEEILGSSLEPIPSLTYPSESLTGKPIPDDGDFGGLNFFAEDDERIRKVNYRMRFRDFDPRVVEDPSEKPLPAISVVAAQKVDPLALESVRDVERIRFCHIDSFPPLSIHQIFLDSVWKENFGDGALFKDKIIFVGATSSDLQDFQTTVIGRFAGVQVHAHALTALLSHSFIRSAPESWRWLGIILAVVVAWSLVTFVRQPLLCLGAVALLAVGSLYGSYLLFDRMSIEFSPLSPMLVLGLCGVAGVAGNFVAQLRESRKLQRFLARYTSPEQAQQMMSDRAGLYTTLQGVERRVTMFFSDVRGFTSMSENMTPTEIVTQLNEYLSRMVERVITHGGIVDKFIGDAVMAEWGATRVQQSEEACRQDAINAVTASLAMRVALEELNAAWRERGVAELKIGMGVHQGDVVVGNIGSESPYEKMDLTVIGDAVNLASRLEGVTKEYGVDLIISEAVHRHVKDDFLCRSADLVAVKGKARPVAVFTVIGPANESPPAGLEAFETGMRLYREGRFDEAQKAFLDCAEAGLDDQLTRVYLERCQNLRDHPPEAWDGVYKMTKK